MHLPTICNRTVCYTVQGVEKMIVFQCFTFSTVSFTKWVPFFVRWLTSLSHLVYLVALATSLSLLVGSLWVCALCRNMICLNIRTLWTLSVRGHPQFTQGQQMRQSIMSNFTLINIRLSSQLNRSLNEVLKQSLNCFKMYKTTVLVRSV